MLQAPGLQGRENLPGWRLEEEFLLSAPTRRGKGQGWAEGRKERNKTTKEKPSRWREAEPRQGKMTCQCQMVTQPLLLKFVPCYWDVKPAFHLLRKLYSIYTWKQDLSSLETKKALLGYLQKPRWGGGFPGGSEVKASASNAGDPGSIPGLGRSPGEGNGNPLQYSCLENPMN